jgi:hypothetical protein
VVRHGPTVGLVGLQLRRFPRQDATRLRRPELAMGSSVSWGPLGSSVVLAVHVDYPG